MSGTDAITWGRDIYINGFAPPSASRTGANFEYVTHLMLHEFTHIKQFQSFSYFTPAFGAKYMFQFCMVSSSAPEG